MIALTTLLAALLPAAAQNSVRIQAPSLVGEGEQFNVTFVVEGEKAPSEFEWSPGSDFQLVWGPQKGSSTSISIVNGKTTKSSQTTYTYVLMPRKPGSFTLPAATARFKGGEISSGRHSIEVVASGKAPSQGGASSQERQKTEPGQGGTVSGEDLFLRMSFSKSRVVVGEPVTAVIKLYTRVNLAGYEDVKFPSFNGFWSQEQQAPSNIEFHREKVGDEIYNSALLRSYTLIPQQAGDIPIEPAEMTCQIMVRAPRSSSGSIFDSFFQDDYRTIRKRVATSAYTLKVSPLPAGAPSSFGGGVGDFRMTASLTRDSLRTHDAASLKVTVSGRGNISMLDAPKVSFPPDFEVYDMKTTESVDKASGRLSGSKTFEFPFIPRSHGDFEIPPVEMSYYDVSAGRYVTLRSQPMTVRVARGSEQEAQPSQDGSVPGVIRKDVRSLGSDIRFIATRTPALKPGRAFFALSPLFWGTAALLALLAALFYILARRAAARRSDLAGSRVRAATKMARKRLSRADAYLKSGLDAAFYEELHRALLGFASDKLNLDVAEMAKENISSRLVESGVSEGLAAEYTALLEACEFARYSSSSDDAGMAENYEKALKVISEIDSSMKHSVKKNIAGAALSAALLLFCSGVSGAAPANYPDSLWKAGAAAYTEGRWEEALSDWEHISDLGVESAQLFYNIGNAWFKQENYAKAILFYERALKADPSFADARFNLEFADSFTQDRIEVLPEFFLKTWSRKFRQLMRSDSWAALSLVFFAVFLAMLLVFLLGSSSRARRAAFFSGIALLLLSLLCFSSAARLRADALKADRAVVMTAVTPVRSTPGADSTKDLFILHEGTRVRILDEVGEWKNIEISDGRRGWIRSNALEII